MQITTGQNSIVDYVLILSLVAIIMYLWVQ